MTARDEETQPDRRASGLPDGASDAASDAAGAREPSAAPDEVGAAADRGFGEPGFLAPSAPPTGLTPSPGLSLPEVARPASMSAPSEPPASSTALPASETAPPGAPAWPENATGFGHSAGPTRAGQPRGFAQQTAPALTKSSTTHTSARREMAPALPEGHPNSARKPAQKRAPRSNRWALIAAGALVVGLGAWGVTLIASKPGGSAGSSTSANEAAEEAAVPAGPGDAVESYLGQLAVGDADGARAMLGSTEFDEAPLLSNEAVFDSLLHAPISDVAIESATESDGLHDATVIAGYRVGGEPVRRQFHLDRRSDEWIITDGTIAVRPGAYVDLGLTLGGIEPSAEMQRAFPIAYHAEIESPWFETPGENGTLLVADEDTLTAFNESDPELTDAGVAAFRTAVKESLADCVDSPFNETDCGMNMTTLQDGWEPFSGTIERTLTDASVEALETLEPVTTRSPFTRMTSYAVLEADAELDATLGDEIGHGHLERPEPTLTPYVDMSEERLTVSWE